MKHKKRTIILGGLFSLALIILAVIYYKGVMFYQVHFLPNTYINGVDCSDLDAEAVITMLDTRMEQYVLDVTGRDYKEGNTKVVLGKILPEDIQLKFAGTREAVLSFLEQQEAYKWFQKYSNQKMTYTFEQSINFNEELLENIVKSWDACQKENMQKPEDAYISQYQETWNRYEVVDETTGTEFDVDVVIELIGDAVRNQEVLLDIEALNCYEEASVRADNEVLTGAVETANKWLSTCVTYDWNGTEVKLDFNILKDWVSLERNIPVLDVEAVRQFVKKQAAAYDTYGKKRSFTTALGVELMLPSGYYGWKTDTEAETEELIQLIYEGAAVQKEPKYSSVAQKKGSSDIGNSYVEADLTHQHLYLYQNGAIVLETDFVSGDMTSKPGNVTPEGVFGVAYKTTNAILRGEDYRTPVNYWMPYYGNYGMHDATWRNEFGGDIYITNGSHGCINLPLDKAAQIYKAVFAGFPVICYYYEVDPLANQNEGVDDNVGENDNIGEENWDEDVEDEPENSEEEEESYEDGEDEQVEDQEEIEG